VRCGKCETRAREGKWKRMGSSRDGAGGWKKAIGHLAPAQDRVS